MDSQDAHPLESRPPTLEDVLTLCRSLNAHGAKYIVVGGIAVIQHGFTRATEDIDLLIERSQENHRKVRAAMEVLPDKAIREVTDDDLETYVVVRVADEVLVDLMLKTCGITYEEASQDIEVIPIQGVPIPFASPRLLLRMKQTRREKDELDRVFLQEKLKKESQGQ